MNQIYIGLSKKIELPKRGYLLIDDEVPTIPRSRVFDPNVHSFNPLENIDYKRAREIAEVLYTIAPQGENTLTVRNGKRALLKTLLKAERFDKLLGEDDEPRRGKRQESTPADEVKGMVDDLLVSPVLKRVLCNPTNFSFN